jgi:Polysaccharide lyase
MRVIIGHVVAMCILAAAVGGAAVASDTTRPKRSSAPPSAADVAFTGGFETGSLAEWSGAQCANTGVPSDASVTRGSVYVTVGHGQGRYAARFDLPAADGRNACEVLAERNIGLGTDDYYGLMVFFPKNWREPSSAGWGLAIAQLGFQGIWGSPISLNAHAHRVLLVVQSGLCSPTSSSSPGCTYSSGPGGNLRPMAAIPAPLALGVWHELIVHVHHATDRSGAVDVWHRLKSQTKWSKTVSLDGYPTVQWTAEGLSTLGYSGTVDKIGGYRGAADFPLTIWQDGFVRATSFAAAARALP